MQTGEGELGARRLEEAQGYRMVLCLVCLSAGDKTCFCPAGMQTGQWPRAEIITLTCCEHSMFTVKNYGGLRAAA